MTAAPPASRGPLFLFLLAGLYGAVFLSFDRLSFPARKDEAHFWPTSQAFSRASFLSLDRLRNYNELNTPLPFVVFGEMERLFHGGIRAGRVLNLLLSFLVVAMVVFAPGRATGRSMGAAAGLLAFPYFMAVSIHLYTDVMAVFFLLGGLAAHRSRRWSLSAACFALAVASRQYAAAFPVALAAWELRNGRNRKVPLAAWVAPLCGAATLAGWFILWRGPAPRAALESQGLVSSAFFPAHGLYALACLGGYFVPMESLLERKPFWRGLTLRWAVLSASTIAVVFVFFPPLGNENYFLPTMGYLDKAARTVLGDPARMVFFAVLAWMAVARFRRFEAASFFAWGHVLIMTRAHIAWDKYALPALAVLWWLSARGEEGPVEGSVSNAG